MPSTVRPWTCGAGVVCGVPLAICDGSYHTVMRTGAAGAVSAKWMARQDARRLAKLFLLDWHADGQLPYAALNVGMRHNDAVVTKAQVWIAENYASPNPISEMATQAGLTERSLLRRFKRATGQAPMQYVQTLRIEEAKQLLETSALSLDDIAGQVGYTEPSAFRRLFNRMVGITPATYRRRFAKVP